MVNKPKWLIKMGHCGGPGWGYSIIQSPTGTCLSDVKQIPKPWDIYQSLHDVVWYCDNKIFGLGSMLLKNAKYSV